MSRLFTHPHDMDIDRVHPVQSCDFEQDKVLDYIFNVFIRPNTTRARSEDLMKSAIECEGLLAVIKRVKRSQYLPIGYHP